MKEDNEIAITLLETLATCNSLFIELAMSIRTHRKVLSVRNDLECRNYHTGSVIEGYVDTELVNGRAICWWLEVQWKEKVWIIDTRIMVNDDEGQHTAHYYEQRISTEFRLFLNQLLQATKELVQFDALALKEAEI